MNGKAVSIERIETINRGKARGFLSATLRAAASLRKRARGAFVLMLAFMLTGLPPSVIEADSCIIIQVTDATFFSSREPSINSDGTRIAFSSTANLTGGNEDNGFEIFLYDTVAESHTQITSSAADSVSPSINADGTRIAFLSRADLDMSVGNEDGNLELFLYDRTANTITQLTDTTEELTILDRPLISADGTRIVFGSFSDLTSDNPDSSYEVFIYDSSTGFTQVTFTEATRSIPTSANADVTRILITSNAALAGGTDDGSDELFLFDASTNGFTQLTDSDLNSGSGAISGDGTRIVYEKPLDGVYLLDTTTNQTTMIASSDAISFSFSFSFSADGSRTAFYSTSNLTDGNADQNREVFLYDIATSTFIQVTETEGPFSQVFSGPTINADGTRVAFESRDDLTGNNEDGSREIFLAICPLADDDEDGDGIPDDSDPDTVAEAVIALPASAFQAPGNHNAVLSRLEVIEQLILAGNTADAIRELQNLRKRVDGCGQRADNNDWIKDCAAQQEIRALIDMLIANLSS